jgi:hypothetical protein
MNIPKPTTRRLSGLFFFLFFSSFLFANPHLNSTRESVVIDTIPPVAICLQNLFVSLDADGMVSLNAALFDAGSFDDSSDIELKVRRMDSNACDPGIEWDDAVDFCCDDVFGDVAVWMRVYDVDVPAGAVGLDDFAGHYTDCLVQVTVQDKLDPVCTVADVQVSCTDFDPSLASYPMPDVFDNCCSDSLQVVVNNSQFDAGCLSGTIQRVFVAVDCSNNFGICTQNIVVNHEQRYGVRFPNDVVGNCNTTGTYGEPLIFNVDCELIGVSFSDEVFDLNPGISYEIERTWSIINWCTYDPNLPLVQVPNPMPNANPNHPSNLVGPTVSPLGTAPPFNPTLSKINPADTVLTNFSTFWSSQSNGYQYTQIIRILDTDGPVFSNCEANLIVCDDSPNEPWYWNDPLYADPATGEFDLHEGAVDLNITVTDSCGGSDVDLAYSLYLDLDGDGLQETVFSSTDDIKPNSVPFMGGASFDQRPAIFEHKYRFALDWITNGNSRTAHVRWDWLNLPVDRLDTILQGAVPLFPYGTHQIVWTATDADGNSSACTTEFQVSDCAPLIISGNVRTEENEGLEEAAVGFVIDPVHPALPPMQSWELTDFPGNYTIQVFPGVLADYILTPYKSDFIFNGVDVDDLSLLNQHVMGQLPLNSPYKRIAADVDGSNSIDMNDVTILQNAIMGLITEFPNGVPIWRFVDASYAFPNPIDPFNPAFPESITLYSVTEDHIDQDFIAVKMGDFNGTVSTHNLLSADDRALPTVSFELPNIDFLAGSRFELPVTVSDEVASCQFTLELDGLNILEVRPEAGQKTGDFAVFKNADGLGCQLTSVQSRAGSFTLLVQAEKAGDVQTAVSLSDAITRTTAYDQNSDRVNPVLRFYDETDSGRAFELYPNTPNPWTGSTLVHFYLPDPTETILTVYDELGRQVYKQQRVFEKGNQVFELDSEQIPSAGVYYYEIRTATDVAGGKMIRL